MVAVAASASFGWDDFDVPTPRLSSTWGMNQDAKKAMSPIGAAMMNTVWIDWA